MVDQKEVIEIDVSSCDEDDDVFNSSVANQLGIGSDPNISLSVLTLSSPISLKASTQRSRNNAHVHDCGRSTNTIVKKVNKNKDLIDILSSEDEDSLESIAEVINIDTPSLTTPTRILGGQCHRNRLKKTQSSTVTQSSFNVNNSNTHNRDSNVIQFISDSPECSDDIQEVIIETSPNVAKPTREQPKKNQLSNSLQFKPDFSESKSKLTKTSDIVVIQPHIELSVNISGIKGKTTTTISMVQAKSDSHTDEKSSEMDTSSIIELSDDEDVPEIQPIKAYKSTSDTKHKDVYFDNKNEFKVKKTKKSLKRISQEIFEANKSIDKKVRIAPTSDFDGPMTTRKNIKKFVPFSMSTIKACRAEQERIKRLNYKRKILLEQIKPSLNEPERVKRILDFNLETKNILVEINPAFFKVMKKHQIEGVKFMFDSTIENVTQFQRESSEQEIVAKGGSFGGILGHCMGLGKTFQVVVFLSTILSNPFLSPRIKCVLIIIPKNVAKNWENEFDFWFHRCQVKRSFGLFELFSIRDREKRANRLELWKQKGGVMLVTTKLFSSLFVKEDSFSNTFEKYLRNPGPDMVIIDEGHMLKNDDSQLNEAASKIKTLRRLIVTGTPLQNNLMEYFCMVSFAKPNLLGTKEEFLNRFVNPIINGQYIDSTEYDVHLMKELFHVLHKRLNSSIHRRDNDLLIPDLKPKLEYVLNIRLSIEQRKLYQYYLDTYVFGRMFGTNTAKRQLFLHFYLLGLIWNHPALLVLYFKKCEEFFKERNEKERKNLEILEDAEDERDFIDLMQPQKLNVIQQIHGDWPHEFVPRENDEKLFNPDLGPKFKFIFSILDECEAFDDKLLIFSQSLKVLDLIEKMLQQRFSKTYGKKYVKHQDYFRIDGSVDTNKRQEIIEQINDDNNREARLLLISTRAGGVGINLVGANRAIIFDTCWNPAHDSQAIYRIFRYGQKKSVFIYRFAASGTMESKVYKRQVNKESIALRVLDEKQIERYYTKGDLHELYELEKDGNIGAMLALPEDRLLAKLFTSHSSFIHSYHMHDSLLINKVEESLSHEEREVAWRKFLEELKEEQAQTLLE